MTRMLASVTDAAEASVAVPEAEAGAEAGQPWWAEDPRFTGRFKSAGD